MRYHSVQEYPERFRNTIGAAIVHSADDFDAHMAVVARHFNPITLDKALACLRDGRLFPRRSVVVTFDDGFRDNHDVAAPILEKHGLYATFYVTAGTVAPSKPPWFCRLRRAFCESAAPAWCDGAARRSWSLDSPQTREAAFLYACRKCARLAGTEQAEAVERIESELDMAWPENAPRLMMTWEEINALRDKGHIIGAHTISHPNLAYTSLENCWHELVESKRLIEAQLSSEVLHFSYPSPMLQPHLTRDSVAMAKLAGYETSATCLPGSVTPLDSPHALPRMIARRALSEFRWDLERATSCPNLRHKPPALSQVD